MRQYAKGIVAAGIVALAAAGLLAYTGRADRVPQYVARADARIVKGFEIAPVELNLRGRNPALVGLGSYIVNAQGGCNDCHTCPPYVPGHDPHEGGDGQVPTENYLGGGTPFGPTLTSANLTPDEHGLPGGMTYAQFVDAIRYGHDPEDPTRILQVMPWPVYGKMVDQDLKAIYEYLSAIPTATAGCQGPPAK